MRKWDKWRSPERLDRAGQLVQQLCLLTVILIEILFFLPIQAADGIVYTFLEWKLVDVSILFLAATACRRRLRENKWYFLLALAAVLWFYAVRFAHMRLEGSCKDPGTFVCAYLLCLPFAAAADDRKQWGLKALAAVFGAVAALFGVYAVLLVLRRLPGFLDGIVFWDGPRFGTMGHPNICATVLMVGIGFTAGGAAAAKRLWLRIALLGLTALEFWALSLTNSRAAVVFTCVLLGGIGFCRLRRPGWKAVTAALAAAVVIAALAFCGSRMLYAWNNARLTELAVQAQQTGEETGLALTEKGNLKSENGQATFGRSLKSLNGRTEIWAAAMQGIRDNPRILLIGTENVGQTISPYWKMEVQHTHSAWVEALYQLGIPGLLAALALTGLAVYNAVVLLWRGDSLFHACAAMVVLCLLGCAVMEPYLFVANIQFHYFDFLFALSLGYLNRWRVGKHLGEREEDHV